MKKTVRELGYGSATGILRWLRETVPDKVSKPVQRKWKVDYPEEIKQAAVIDLCESNSSTADIAEKYGISRATLYEWKVQYIGKGNCILKQQKLNSKEYYINEINRLKEEKRLVEQELKKTQAELYRAHLEKDVYEKAAEILKKEMGDNLKEFSNQEKAMVIMALRDKEVRTIFGPNVGQHWGQEPGTRRNVVPDFWYYSATYQESEKIR